MAKKRGRKAALRIFEKGTKARRRVKRALRDKTVSRKELKRIIKGGATKKQVRQLGRTVSKSKGLKSKFLTRGERGARKTASDFYSKIKGRMRQREAAQAEAATDQTDDILSGIRDIISEGKETAEEATGDLETLFGGQLDDLISGQDAFREDMKDMFSNMMALGAGRAGALGVRSARRRPLGQAGTTGQFGREGLRIRSINI
jgi:hypothetical protein